MIDLVNHPRVQKAAEGVINELSSINRDGWSYAVEEMCFLLCDLTRPDSRDWWVRQGIDMEGDLLTMRERPSPANDLRQNTLHERWGALRDDPPALEKAIRAVLSAS